MDIRSVTITAETSEPKMDDGLDTIAYLTSAVAGDDAIPLAFHNYRKVSPGTYVHLDDVCAELEAYAVRNGPGRPRISSTSALRRFAAMLRAGNQHPSRTEEAIVGPSTATMAPVPIVVSFVTWDANSDGVAVEHDGDVVWRESSFDSLGQYLMSVAPIGVPVILTTKVVG